MPERSRLKTAIQWLDHRLADVRLSLAADRAGLVSFVFHGLFRDQEELESWLVDPQQGITVEMFRRVVRHFRDESYEFVSPDSIVQGLGSGKKYVLLTFDDGYYNNLRALPVLEEFNVPVVLFVSTGHVKHGKAFWWDVVFRGLRKLGKTDAEIHRAVGSYKALKTAQIEAEVTARFGEGSLRPLSDLDRPFSPDELKAFASHPLVYLGNHTQDHAILSNYPTAEIRDQILGAQQDLRELTGRSPNIIAYPDGAYSREIADLAKAAGLNLGLLATPGRNRLPLKAGTNGAMKIKRFLVWGNSEIDGQCKVYRSDLSLYRALSHVRCWSHPSFSR